MSSTSVPDRRSPISSGSERSQIPDDPEVINIVRSSQSPRPIGHGYYQEEKIPVPVEEGQSPFSVVTDGSQVDRAPLHYPPEVSGHDAPEVVSEKSGWRKHKSLWLILLIVLLVVIIALATGLGVGLTRHKKERAGDASATPEETNDTSNYLPCNATLCPQVLSVAEFNDKYYIFGRNSDNQISYRVGWDDWNQTWTTLKNAPASIITQPVAIGWEPQPDEPRIDIVVVTAEGNVWGSHLGNKWWSDWEAMGPYAGSQIVSCQMTQNRTDLWTNDNLSHNVSHTYWLTGDDDQKWWNDAGRWQILPSGPAKSAPGAACRYLLDVTVTHDIVWYDRDERIAWHMSFFRRSGKWGTAKSFAGTWIGDPILVSYGEGSERVDFFGIQENRHMYHFSKEEDKTYSDLEDLQGQFASVPSVISRKIGIYDVVALGMDGYLYHQHYDNSTRGWWDHWEKLNITAESAPTAVQLNKSVEIVYLDRSGGMMSVSVTPDGKDLWGDAVLTNIGTGMTFMNRFYGDGL